MLSQHSRLLYILMVHNKVADKKNLVAVKLFAKGKIKVKLAEFKEKKCSLALYTLFVLNFLWI